MVVEISHVLGCKMGVCFETPRKKFLENHLMAELKVVVTKDTFEAPNQRGVVI